jgi:integrase
MASPIKRGTYYYGRFYDADRSPRRKEVPLRVKRKSAAWRKLIELEKKFELGEWDPWTDGTDAQPLTAQEAVKAFLDEKARSVRPRTLDTYRQQLERWLQEHTPPALMIRDARASHLEPFVRQDDISAATRCKRYRHLRVFMRWCEDAGHVAASPLDDVPRPKKEKGADASLSEDDLKRLLRTIERYEEESKSQPWPDADLLWLRDLIQVAICTGLRRGELCNLRWEDIDLDMKLLTVRNREDFRSKSGHERRVPLAGDALRVLTRMHAEHQGDPTDHVFQDRKGRRIRPNRATKRFKAMVREAKLPDAERLKLHSTRHTAGSWLTMKGVPLRVTSQILGHSSTSVTERYSHLQPEVARRAIEETFE